MANGRIVIRRPRQFADQFRRYHIKLDDKKCGSIKAGAVKEIEATVGEHRLSLTIDWARSPELVIDVASGEPAVVLCGCDVRPMAASLALFTKTASWIRLQQVDASRSNEPL